MAYLAGFDADIFVSYSHLDKHPVTTVDRKGSDWVKNFHSQLEWRIVTFLGHHVTIWRDPHLGGETKFSAELDDRLKSAAILLVIVSPGYLASDWCERERETFVEAAKGNGGLDIGNARRIIRAVKYPAPNPIDDLPEVLQSTLGFNLYDIDEQSGDPISLEPDEERRVMDRLALAIVRTLKLMSASPNSPHATVYLAETTSDVKSERDKIRRELEARHCLVVPHQPLPLHFGECSQAVGNALKTASLSVHLLGKAYGVIPEGGQESVVEIQTRLASAISAPAFKAVLWVPPGLLPEEERQRVLLEHIRTRLAKQTGLELLETPFPKLKDFLIQNLESAAEAGKQPTPVPLVEPIPQVYLVRDKTDAEAVAPLEQFFFGQGVEVLTPLDEGDPGKVRINHDMKLTVCQGVLIWWGNSTRDWLENMIFDLDRVPSLDRKKPLLTKAVCVARPAAPEKEKFKTLKAQVLHFYDSFASEPLSPIVKAIKAAANAST